MSEDNWALNWNNFCEVPTRGVEYSTPLWTWKKSGITEEGYKFFVIFLVTQENFTGREFTLNFVLSVPHQSSWVTFAPGRVKHNFKLRRFWSLLPFTDFGVSWSLLLLFVPAEEINVEKGLEQSWALRLVLLSSLQQARPKSTSLLLPIFQFRDEAIWREKDSNLFPDTFSHQLGPAGGAALEVQLRLKYLF